MDALVNKIFDSESKVNGVFVEKRKIYTFLNPVSYLEAKKQSVLYNNFDGIFADGSLLVAAIKILYGLNVTRRSFDMTSVAPCLFEYIHNNNKTLYIVGSKQDQVEIAVNILRKKYEGINILGYRSGYFANEEEKINEAKYITKLNPDFVIVGMGVIKQEHFLLMVKEAGFHGIGFTCGGFIHQTACGESDYYPGWIDRMNLRFLYRMWKEPHTRKRYLTAGFIFPVRFAKEKFFG